MAFAVFADGSANLPKKYLDGINLLPCEYTVDGKRTSYDGDVDHFDAHAFYESLKNGSVVKTSLINMSVFLENLAPVLNDGLDVIYICMSSGISGTYSAAMAAARELMEEYKGRFVHVVDSHGCGFGNGLLAIEAVKLLKKGLGAREAAKVLDETVPHICQYFTVDDLNFLKKTGRVSGVTAAIGTVLNIKPILYGDSTGHIVSCAKVRGRRKAIDAIVEKFQAKYMDTEDPRIFISHGDCIEDARELARRVEEAKPGVPIEICEHEPFSGAHVGPGMLALFFKGTER